jgi:hypothetical protein
MATFQCTIFSALTVLAAYRSISCDEEQPDEHFGDALDGEEESGDPMSTCPRTALLKTDVANRREINTAIMLGTMCDPSPHQSHRAWSFKW